MCHGVFYAKRQVANVGNWYMIWTLTSQQNKTAKLTSISDYLVHDLTTPAIMEVDDGSYFDVLSLTHNIGWWWGKLFWR